MNYYDILGISPDASQDQIKKAYKELVKKNHPDKGGNSEQFKLINDAYDTLKDPAKRQQYDNPSPRFDNNFSGHPFEDLFESIFRQQQRQIRNKNIRIRVDIDLAECMTGKSLIVSYMLGNGKQTDITIEIPSGVSTGDTIRFQGLGDNTVTQLPRGDLHVVIFVKDLPGWRREHNNLFINKNVNVLDLITGCAIIIETLEGNKLSLNIPSGTKPETTFSMKGYGLPEVNTKVKGNLYVKIKADVPKITDIDVINQIENIKKQLEIKE
jgi:curved DNA-binding protein